MRTNILKLVIEVQNPTSFICCKLSQLVQKIDHPFVKFDLELKDEIKNSLDYQYLEESTGIYNKYNSGKNIVIVLNNLNHNKND